MAAHWASARRPGTASRTRPPPKAEASPRQPPAQPRLPPPAPLGPKITPWTEYHIARGLEELRKLRAQREAEVQSTRSIASTAASQLSYASLLSTQSAPAPPTVPLIHPLPLAEGFDSRPSSSSLPDEFRRLEAAKKARSRLKPLPKRPPLSGPQDAAGDRRQRVEYLRKLYTNQADGPPKGTPGTPPLSPTEPPPPGPARSPAPRPSASPHATLTPLARPPPPFPLGDPDSGSIGPSSISPVYRIPHLLPALPPAVCAAPPNPLPTQSPLRSLRSPGCGMPSPSGTSGTDPRARGNGSAAPSPTLNSTLGEDEVESLIQWTQQLDLRASWTF